jgi:hypothetical protein
MFEVSEKQDFRLEQQEQSESDKSDDFIHSRSCVETKSNAGDDEGVHQTDWFAVVQAENTGGQDDKD